MEDSSSPEKSPEKAQKAPAEGGIIGGKAAKRSVGAFVNLQTKKVSRIIDHNMTISAEGNTEHGEAYCVRFDPEDKYIAAAMGNGSI